MENTFLKKLATVNLKFSYTAKPLKVLAFANISVKALFLLEERSSIKQITQKVAEILNVDKVDETLIKEALDQLKIEKKINHSKKGWVIEEQTKKAIEDEINQNEKCMLAVLNRHFPKKIDNEIVCKWYTEALVDFFSFYGNEWIKSICKNERVTLSGSRSTAELLKGSILKYGLEQYEQELVNAFNGFVLSTELEDQKYLSNIGFAMFSSELVTADVGVDPITLDEIKDSTFILDTNVLFAISLDAHRFSKSIPALGKALAYIKAELRYINPTKNEYRNLLLHRKNEILAIINSYPEEILKETRDDFIKTARTRQCVTITDYERFFKEIETPPSQIESGPEIKELDDSEIQKIISRSQEDTSKKNLVNSAWKKKRHLLSKNVNKPESSTIHDVSLLNVTEHERKRKQKTWILSLDGSLQNVSSQLNGPHTLPSVMSLEGLIQVLAINNAGPNKDASDFGPLMASLIANRCIPPENTFTVEDLFWIHSVEQGIPKFSADKIKRIINEVVKSRLSGGGEAENKKLQLVVQRMYQEDKREYSKEIEDLADRVNKAESASTEKQNKIEELEKEIKVNNTDKCIRDVRIALAKSLSWRIPLFLILSWSVWRLIIIANFNDKFSFFISLVQAVIWLYTLLKEPVIKYQSEKNSCIS